MRAIVATPGTPHSVRLTERERPRPAAGEYLIKVLDVGIDGTDEEIDSGEYGAPPAGETVLTIGHECIGVIVEESLELATFSRGDLVVPTVRRPCPERCLNCRNGEFDFCITGNYRERGISQLHGYMSDYYAESPDCLVLIPPALRSVGVLLEPLSIAEKAFREIDTIQKRMRWVPRRALITGAGGLGMLTACLARLRGYETTVYSLGTTDGARSHIIRQLGLTYIDADGNSLADVARQVGPPDVIFEATGHSPLAWEAMGILGINGVACLLSVTGGELGVEIPSNELNNRMVLGNRVVFGSVNAHRRDFEQGVDDLAAIEERWPGALASFETRRLPMDRIREALDDSDPTQLKSIIEVATDGANG
ncbi:MAG: glucose 1-dehydrogenase [Gemmatimonadaceae bacterium]